MKQIFSLLTLALFLPSAARGEDRPRSPFTGGFRFCVSKDGKRLAVGCWDVWDVAARKSLFNGKTHGSHGMNFSPDGKLLAVVGNYSEFYVYDARTGKEYWNLTLKGHGDTVLEHVEFTADSKFMVSSSANGLLKVWDVKAKKARALFCFPSRDGYAQAGQDEYLRAWRTLNGDKPPDNVKTFVVFEKEIKHFGDFALSPDGKTVAVPTRDSEVLLIELETGKLVKRLDTKQESTCTVAYSPDGKTLAVGGSDGRPDRKTCTIELWDVAAKKRLRTLAGHRQTVLHLAFSPDSKSLASGGLIDGVRVWDVAKGKEKYRLHEQKGDSPRNLGVAFLPDGKALLTLPDHDYELEERLGLKNAESLPVHFWEPLTGKRIPKPPLGKKEG